MVGFGSRYDPIREAEAWQSAQSSGPRGRRLAGLRGPKGPWFPLKAPLRVSVVDIGPFEGHIGSSILGLGFPVTVGPLPSLKGSEL